MRTDVAGTPFGRYRLLELLGHGGMGEVWRAHDTAIDRTVAIKTLLPHFAQDEKFEQRFRREARIAARLDNPHIVPIYDFGEIDGRLYVSMRLVNGQDLSALIDEEGALPPQRAVALIEQIAKALNSAHKAGLIHRDIKPSNILLADDDFAYLIDFGIARAEGETGLTSTGLTIGTWSYMAPERFSTGTVDASSDIYALTCVLYECLTAQLPFPAIALEQIVAAHMTTPPPRPSRHNADIPNGLDEVIATGLAKQPVNRYQTAAELATAARSALTEAPNRLLDEWPPATKGATPPGTRSAHQSSTAQNDPTAAQFPNPLTPHTQRSAGNDIGEHLASPAEMNDETPSPFQPHALDLSPTEHSRGQQTDATIASAIEGPSTWAQTEQGRTAEVPSPQPDSQPGSTPYASAGNEVMVALLIVLGIVIVTAFVFIVTFG